MRAATSDYSSTEYLSLNEKQGTNMDSATLLSHDKFIVRAKETDWWHDIEARLIATTPAQSIYDIVSEIAINNPAFRAQFFRLPFPDVARTGIGYASDKPDIAYTIRAGLSNIRKVNQYWKKHRLCLRKDAARVVDFGCGSGRLLRFPCEFGEGLSLSACDVNPQAVEWLGSCFPCDVHLMQQKWDLSFLTEQMDLIWGWSIFTHFSEDEHLRWLASLTKALAPGGLLIATFKSIAMLDRMASDPAYRSLSRADNLNLEELRENAKGGFLFFECYDKLRSTAYGVDASSFGQAYIAHDYVRNRWSHFADVLEITTAVPNWQDIVVLRKRASGV